MNRNPITDANSLLASLQTLLVAPHTQTPKTQKTLNDVLSSTTQTIQALKELSEYVPLDILSQEEKFENYLLWENFEGGLIPAKETFCTELIKKSPTLNDLRKSSITIKNLYKFKSDELEVAEVIGDNFRLCNYEIDQLKSAVSVNKFQTFFYGGNAQNAKRLIEGLKQKGLFTSYSTSLLDFESKKYVLQDKEDFSKLKLTRDQKVKIEFNEFKKEYVSLLMGDWFNAYAYSNILEQLHNYEIKFELYTKVTYEASPDVISTAGDFDVLARIGKQILFIECKSGTIGNDNSSSYDISPEIKKILRKSDDLAQLFKKVKSQIEHFTSWLIFNPYLKENKLVKTQMKDTNILALDPSEVRGAIVDIINQIAK